MDVWAIRITLEKSRSNSFELISHKAGFHSRQSQSWIRRYDSKKIKLMESEEMWSPTIQWKLDCRIESNRMAWVLALWLVLFFHLCLRLRQFSFHWIISFGVMRGIGSKWNSSDFSDTDSGQLMTPFTTAIFTLSMALFRLRLWVRLWCKPPWTW